ncbi:MAG: outer membrane beta-barrel protein [Ferruginibacter sp.]
MLRKILTSCVIVGTFNSVYAQTDSIAPVSPAPTITGSVDTYFRYNFGDPKDGVTNNFTSFTNSQNSFQLGMASIRADHTFGNASATVDLGFGPRAEEFSYLDPDHPTLFAVKQAYLSYAISSKFKLTMGKWMTHIGYELTDAYLNRNYSMDYMFSYGPFSHTGLKADIGLGAKNALMIGIANTTDAVAKAGSRRYAIAQFSTGTSDDKLKAYVNYQGSYGGSFNVTQFDVVLTDAVTSKFSLGYNGTVQTVKPEGASSSSWWGSAVYVTADPTTAFGITLRAECFDNKKEVVSAPPTSIFDFTLSPNFRVGNLTIIPELRLDAAQNPVFEKNDNSSTKSTVTGLLAVTYHF